MSLFKGAPGAESGDVVTVIGPETYFQGVITVRSSLRIEGEVEGDITEAQAVIIGRRGRVKGDINADSVIVAGSVSGNVTATAHLELKSGGRIAGNIRTARLLIEEGASFDGSCSMGEAAKPEGASPAQGQAPAGPEKKPIHTVAS
ncbi:MAG: polymer-forming cytoskeletal protein [Elusimicrobia bacterium]|nr:polymer-forming cytoskeletal protein [Elusimicrobiota bacterium]